MIADVQRELAEALTQLWERGAPFVVEQGGNRIDFDRYAAALLPTVQALIVDAEKRAAAAAVTEEREAAYWKVMDAADVWMSHDKRARASVVCDFLMDLGNDIKLGRPFRSPVAYAAALDPSGAAEGAGR